MNSAISRTTQALTFRAKLCLLILWINTPLSMLLTASAAQHVLPGPNPKVFLEQHCDGYAINGIRRGVVYSHSSADRYAPNSDCTIYFNVKNRQVVHFHFELFKLQKRVRGKCVDYVQFFTERDLKEPLTEPFCGHNVPQSIAFNSSRIVLLFRSNSEYETEGFRLRFVQSDIKCDMSDTTCANTNLKSPMNKTYLPAVPAIFLLFPFLLVCLAACLHYS